MTVLLLTQRQDLSLQDVTQRQDLSLQDVTQRQDLSVKSSGRYTEAGPEC